MLRGFVLAIHVASGVTGLIIGPLAMRAPKRRGRHTRLGAIYQVVTATLCSSAIVLVAFHPAVWPLAVIATATEAAALGGRRVRRRAKPGWLPTHVSLMCGSYVSFVTAFLVVNFRGSIIPWIVPTIVATPLIARASARAATTPVRPQETPSSPVLRT
jgi:hypothetical protein